MSVFVVKLEHVELPLSADDFPIGEGEYLGGGGGGLLAMSIATLMIFLLLIAKLFEFYLRRVFFIFVLRNDIRCAAPSKGCFEVLIQTHYHHFYSPLLAAIIIHAEDLFSSWWDGSVFVRGLSLKLN